MVLEVEEQGSEQGSEQTSRQVIEQEVKVQESQRMMKTSWKMKCHHLSQVLPPGDALLQLCCRSDCHSRPCTQEGVAETKWKVLEGWGMQECLEVELRVQETLFRQSQLCLTAGTSC